MGLDSTLPLAFGLVSLLVLQLIVVRGKVPMRAVVGLFVVGLAVGVAAVGWWLAPPRYLPAASTSGLAVAVAEDIRKGLSAEESPHFLILDGGSYSVRGINDVMLEERLSQEMGSPFEVLAISIAGGNQLERWTVLKRAMALLDAGERERFAAAQKTLLFEIHAQYDRYPLRQFLENPRSDRAYAYVGLDVLRQALRADHGDMDRDARMKEWAHAASIATINFMNIGRATRVVPADKMERGNGYSPLDRPANGYQFEGTKAARQSLKKPAMAVDRVPWRNVELRRERYETLLGQKPDIVYFSVPTPRASDLRYVRGFCEGIAEAPCVTHAHWGLLDRLDHAYLWYDSGHLQGRGADVYTRWFAARLADALKDEGRP